MMHHLAMRIVRPIWHMGVLAVLALLSSALPAVGTARAQEAPSQALSAPLRIVFSAVPRNAAGDPVGHPQIFTVNEDGTEFRRLTQDDDVAADWPVWAMEGRQILYAIEAFGEREDESGIYLMNADGSNPRRVLAMRGRLIQPKMSPDGRSVIFVASWRDFPVVAIYRLDLDTMKVRNLTAVTTPDIGFDSDVRWTPDGRGVVFVSGPVESGVVAEPRVFQIDADGGNRRALTTDRSWHTDPMFAPDGRTLAISTYRGEGFPFPPELRGRYPVPYDWFLVLRDPATGAERLLTQGKLCALRTPAEAPCSPEEGPAWIPVWSPDGSRLSYISARRFDLIGIYSINADGTGARPLIEIPGLAIIWHDWAAPPGDAVGATVSQSESSPVSRLLFGAVEHPTRLDLAGNVWPAATDDVALTPRLFTATPDRWHTDEVALASMSGLTLLMARWTPERDGVVFTARVPLEELERPNAPSAAVVPRMGGDREAGAGPDESPEMQVFLATLDRAPPRQLTHPWTEDLLDGLPEGDLRANLEPDVSPGNRSVVFANVSTTRDESWILRQDLATGEVVNLTSMTCGLATCYDRAPRYAPDGSHIAFTSRVDGAMQLFVMDADGRSPKRLTRDSAQYLTPAWSPDGAEVAYVTGGSAPDIYVVPAAGGAARPLQVTSTSWELFVDWR